MKTKKVIKKIHKAQERLNTIGVYSGAMSQEEIEHEIAKINEAFTLAENKITNMQETIHAYEDC